MDGARRKGDEHRPSSSSSDGRTAHSRAAPPSPIDCPLLHPLAENEFPQEVPVALLLILSTVAHQRDAAPSRELLHQAQRKLLAVVLDGSAALEVIPGPIPPEPIASPAWVQ